MKLVDIGQGFQLEEKAGAAFARLKAEAEAVGHTVEISTAYRSREYQTKLYGRYIKVVAAWEKSGRIGKKPPPVAPPGKSEHESGTALDIHVSSRPELFTWLMKNSTTYGFYFTANSEKWHIAFYPSGPPANLFARHLENLKSWA